MFKCVIMLKVSPWFLYADSEADALTVSSSYGENVSGIVFGDNVIVKQPVLKMSLSQDQVFQIAAPEKKEDELTANQDDEQFEIDKEQASKELEDEFEKLQP